MSFCLFCDSTLVRNFHHGGVHLFCPTCYQDMPSADQDGLKSPLRAVEKKSPGIQELYAPATCARSGAYS